MLNETIELIRKAQADDKLAAEQLLEQNTGLIWSIVRRFLGRGIETDDLYQLGCLGFVKAIKGFDLNYGTQFSTYAVPKISGEIRRFMRDDGMIKVSRSTKDLATKIFRVRQMLEGKLGREPKISEIAEELEITIEEIAACDTAIMATDSLQRDIGEDGLTIEKMLGSEGIEDKIIENLTLESAISKLPNREKMVINLRFFKCLTQEKTAKIMQISQVQVSRIERKAISILREKIS